MGTRSKKKPEKSPTKQILDRKVIAELAALVGRREIAVKDASGQEHVLNLLDMTDYVEFQDYTAKHSDIGSNATILEQTRLLLYMVYLSIRRNGCSRDQVDRGEYSETLGSTGRKFTPVQFNDPEFSEAITKVSIASGWLDEGAIDGLDPTLRQSVLDALAEVRGVSRVGNGPSQ